MRRVEAANARKPPLQLGTHQHFFQRDKYAAWESVQHSHSMRLPAFILAVPAFILRHRRVLVVLCIVLLCEIAFHIYHYRTPRPPIRLDAPFYTGCQDTSQFEAAPRENATILMLARNQDVDGAVSSIISLEHSFNSWAKYPITFLNDEVWEQGFMDAVKEAASGDVQFGVIDEEM